MRKNAARKFSYSSCMTITDGTYQKLYTPLIIKCVRELKKGYTLIIYDTECFKYASFSWKFIRLILMRCADAAQS